MIRVLVVDDDKLARRGIISAMPWAKHGMTVVGEASNGKKALEFLQQHPVDLLLTDIAMPLMSGLELMRAAKDAHPDLAVVVLTLHQDFEYIQQALRLGALDYIAKVQLEVAYFDEVLERIRQRLSSAPAKERALPGDVRVLLTFDHAAPDEPLLPQLAPLARGAYLLKRDIAAPPDAMLLRVTGTQGLSMGQLREAMERYLQQRFFYDYAPGEREIGFADLGDSPAGDGDESMLEALCSLDWLSSDERFEAIMQSLQRARTPYPRLMKALIKLEGALSAVYQDEAQGIRFPEQFLSLHQLRQFLTGLRRRIQQQMDQRPLSREVAACIARAVAIVEQEYNRPLLSQDIARRINLNRSYFSECFKKTTGLSFNHYVRNVRIDKARQLLTQTSKPIAWIADACGYLDEKYFSKVFKAQTGELPSEYRQRLRKK